ncbi:MAG: winged helix-turn-helix transcriptional regulator [Myxococcales bacterium]|jgi:DNA-binding transcriptional ArsR family regulator|nr:winged helix-turn-helix transcriptional regulator [Myxococcales bacterium]
MFSFSDLAKKLKVLSVASRLQILQLLRDRALCVGAIAAQLDVTQGAVSQHLRVLREAGLVVSEKRGFHVHYRLNETAMEEWRGIICDLLTLDSDCYAQNRKANGPSCRNRSSKQED